jgi:hypothetical protein
LHHPSDLLSLGTRLRPAKLIWVDGSEANRRAERFRDGGHVSE